MMLLKKKKKAFMVMEKVERNGAFYLREKTVAMYQLVCFMSTTGFFDAKPEEWSPE